MTRSFEETSLGTGHRPPRGSKAGADAEPIMEFEMGEYEDDDGGPGS